MPRALHAGPAPTMAYLDRRHAAVVLQKVDDRPKCFDLAVFPQAEATIGDPAVASHCGRLDKHQPCPTLSELAVVDQVMSDRKTIACLILVHWRHGDSIGQRDITKPERGKQHGGFSRHHALALFRMFT